MAIVSDTWEAEIGGAAEDLEPFTFLVRLPVGRDAVDEELVEQMIAAHKPAHATCEIHFAGD